MYVEASIKPRKVNKPPRKVYQYNKANTEELKEKFRSIDIEKQLKEQDLTVDQLWNNFKEKVLDIMNQSIPTKMINNSKRKLPWINREMKSLTTKRNKYFKKMKQHPSNSSLINKVEVIPGISDHEIVYVEASIKPRMDFDFSVK